MINVLYYCLWPISFSHFSPWLENNFVCCILSRNRTEISKKYFQSGQKYTLLEKYLKFLITNEMVHSWIYRTFICYSGLIKHLANLNAKGKTSEMIDSLYTLNKKSLDRS